MGFGILAGAFSRGVNNGINAVNSLQDMKDRKARQKTLDSRYQDQIARQGKLDQLSEQKYRDTQTQQGVVNAASKLAHADAVAARAASLGIQSKRLDLLSKADARVQKKADAATAKAAYDKKINFGVDAMTAIEANGDSAWNSLFNTTDNGKALMEQFNLKDVNAHTVPGVDANGKTFNKTYISAIGPDGNRGLLDPKTMTLHKPDDQAAYFTRQGMMTVGMHLAGLNDKEALTVQAKFARARLKNSANLKWVKSTTKDADGLQVTTQVGYLNGKPTYIQDKNGVVSDYAAKAPATTVASLLGGKQGSAKGRPSEKVRPSEFTDSNGNKWDMTGAKPVMVSKSDPIAILQNSLQNMDYKQGLEAINNSGLPQVLQGKLYEQFNKRFQNEGQ